MRKLVFMALLFVWALQTPAGTSESTFTYQGRLSEAGTPVAGPVNLTFRLFDADTAGVQIGAELTLLNFSNFGDGGEFTVDLDFGAGAFPGDARWLEVWVDGAPLTPRQPVRPTPHALHAVTAEMVPDGGLPATYSSAVNFSNAGNNFSGAFTGSGAGLTALNASNISAGTLNAARLPLPLTLSDTNQSHIIRADNASSNLSSSAVFAVSLATENVTYGIRAWNFSTSGRGVFGSAKAGTGQTYGVWAESDSTSGRGVFGYAGALTGFTVGVIGQSRSDVGTGVVGQASSSTGTPIAVRGSVNSPTGYAGYFVGGRNYFGGNVGIGNTDPAYPLHVETGSDGSDRAIFGQHTAASGEAFGGFFESGSTGGRGVFGRASAASGLTRGVYGLSDSNTGTGVLGAATATSGSTWGVRGTINSPDGYAGYFSGPEGSKNFFQRSVGIGTLSPMSMFHVIGAENNGTDAAVRIVSGEQTMLLDGNEIDSFPAGLYLNHNVAHNVLLATGGGNVGIGTTAPAQLLSVNGTAGKPGGGSWSTFSDARLKKNIQPLTGSLDQLLALHGVMFEYRDPDTINELPGIRIGMIAQDVEKVFPDWVSDSPNGYKSLSFSGFEALTVEALRELIGKLVKQESAAQRQRQELATLAEENDRMRERLAELELKVEAMLAGSPQ